MLSERNGRSIYSRDRHHSRRRKRFLAVFSTKKKYFYIFIKNKKINSVLGGRGETGDGEREQSGSLDCGQDEYCVGCQDI
jgi:hypothetical protein